MSIKLEWEVEADESPDRILHDPGNDPSFRRTQRIRHWLIGAAITLIITTTIGVSLRLNAVEAQRAELLNATVSAELLALRIGDYTAYMRTQSQDEEWREHQRQAFADLSNLGTRVIFSEEISEIIRQRDEAQIIVEATLDGEPTEITWHYAYTEHGWRHIQSPPEPWAAQEHRVGNVLFRYHAIDQSVVDDLVPLIEEWQDTVQQVGDVRALEPIELQLDPNIATITLQGDSPTVLLIPMPASRSHDETPELDHSTRVELANWLVDHWTEEILGESLLRDDEWVRDETEAYLRWVFHGETEPTPLMTTLSEAYPLLNLMTVFVTGTSDGLGGAEALRAAIAENTVVSGQSVPSNEFLTAYLQAEAILAQQSSIGRSAVVFMENATWSREPSALVQFNHIVLEGAYPETFTVVGTYTAEDIMWVELEYRGPWQLPTDDRQESMPFAFRLTDGYWQHSAFVTRADWGVDRSSRHGDVYVFYQAADTPFVEGLAVYINGIYPRLAADLGVDLPPEPLSVNVEPPTRITRPDSQVDEITPRLTSPLGRCCVVIEDGQAFLRQQAMITLIAELVSYKTQKPIDVITPVMLGMAQWQAMRIEPETWQPHPFPDSTDRVATPRDLWPDPTSSWSPDPFLRIAYTHALLNAIESEYGHDAALTLIDNFDLSEDLDAWLGTPNLTYVEIEALWQYHIIALETQLKINALYNAP